MQATPNIMGINALENSKIIDKIVVAIDCKEIANVVKCLNLKKVSIYWSNR